MALILMCATARFAGVLRAVLVLAGIGLLGTGCAGHAGREGSPRTSRAVPYAGPHPDITGYWQIEQFVQRDPKMPTCFGQDAGVEFQAGGTWTGINRDQHHTYSGTYFFTSSADVELDAGVTQRYSVTTSGDVMSFRSGNALMMTLRKAERPSSAGPGQFSTEGSHGQ
jgi:hypothetical protein